MRLPFRIVFKWKLKKNYDKTQPRNALKAMQKVQRHGKFLITRRLALHLLLAVAVSLPLLIFRESIMLDAS